MTLRDYIVAVTNGVNWTSPSGPEGQDWGEMYVGQTPIPHDHPPSLKNPRITPIPTSQDGWHKGDSKAAREQARADLVELHHRMRRQIGKPEVAHTAQMPLFPDIQTWL